MKYTEKKISCCKKLDDKIWHNISQFLAALAYLLVFQEANTTKSWLLQPIKNIIPYFTI